MDIYRALRDEVLQINTEVLALFSTAQSIPGMSDYSFGNWGKTCAALPQQLAEDIIRVAIVGPIKSGKSTLMNSIFKGDYVKRGAGVVTSIVTRVRNGDRLRAKLFFKSWDEVNAEMEQALVLFPSLNWRSENSAYDIRQEKDRSDLQRALADLSGDQLITQETRNLNNVLLSSYLKGYETVINLFTPENTVRLFEQDRFSDHKAFVGNESLAVYLKDILLEINSKDIQSNIEIADCQGSDSSNPLHLTMIQDYLLLTHLIVYVVSSRTGLRQADIRFLAMIKKMGILENTLFVINCDFSEHESIDDLKSLVHRVREELAMVQPQPQICTFSALYNLFSSQHDELSDKNRLRLQQWRADRELLDFSNLETVRFDSIFNDILARQRSTLLLQNHVERLGVILDGTYDWVRLSRDVLARDAGGAAELVEKIRRHQQRLNQIKLSVKNTLSGAGPEIKKELDREVNRFFDLHSDNIVKDIVRFISGYTLAPDTYEKSLDVAGFSQTLYQVFQEFKHSLDSFITEVANPEVIRFIHSKEQRIGEYFEALIAPFDTMIEDAFAEYPGWSQRTKFVQNGRTPSRNLRPAMDSIAQQRGLRRPPFVATMHYSARTKTEAMVRLGFYRAVRNVKILFKKSANPTGGEALRALKDAVRRMQLEVGKSMVFHLKDYQENLKFGYFHGLVEAASDSFAQALLDRFQTYLSDISTTIGHLGKSQFDKEKALKILNEMDQVLQGLSDKLAQIRRRISYDGILT
jgi:GTPase SAR1 family protein